MRKKSIDEIVRLYEEYSIIKDECIREGKYRPINKEMKKLLKIYKLFEEDEDYAHKCIDTLLEKEDIILKSLIATYCLSLNYKVEDALNFLEKIASDPQNGVYKFEAEMTLKVWKEQGYLKMY